MSADQTSHAKKDDCPGFQAVPNAPCWMQIPAYDVARARAFYAAVLAFEYREPPAAAGVDPASMVHVHFPGPFAQSLGGGIVRRKIPEGATELTQPPLPERGTGVVYFWVEDIKAAMERVEKAGGKCMSGPVHEGGGWHVDFRDTEGNFHGLYTMTSPKE